MKVSNKSIVKNELRLDYKYTIKVYSECSDDDVKWYTVSMVNNRGEIVRSISINANETRYVYKLKYKDGLHVYDIMIRVDIYNNKVLINPIIARILY